MLFGKRETKLRRILIVEDEPLVAFENEHFLLDCGYEVVATVDRVEDAVAAIASEAIDLVLADVQLSDGGDGLDVARAAQARGVPVLFVTGNCPVEARAVAVGCLAKPYSSRDLRAAIEAVDAALRGAKPKRLPAGFDLYA